MNHTIQSPYLFVYGTLMSGMHNPYAQTMSQSATCKGKACTHGLLYDYHGEYPCAVASIQKKDTILGELYELHHPARVLTELDTYEDCDPTEPGKSLFVRCVIPAKENETGQIIHAWMYFWNQPVHQMHLITNGDYRNQSR
ncbi:MAG: gamma-glutamylcyclotransferase [Verrucomicrobia bacterium]|nr:gamma-glutamylcyclotransferase [Verrucomicrobiota bacterium]